MASVLHRLPSHDPTKALRQTKVSRNSLAVIILQALPIIDAPHEKRLTFVANSEKNVSSGVSFHAFYSVTMSENGQTLEWISINGHRVKTNVFACSEDEKLRANRGSQHEVCILLEDKNEKLDE